MAIATPEVYAEMIDRAKAGKFAYPAVNVTSSQTLTAALQGFAEAESDGIIQVSVGGAEYAAGSTVKDRVAGSLALAAYAAEVAKGYPITVALHTDHCAKQNLDSWVRPLLALEIEQVKAGKLPTFQSHMWDGSSVPLDENLIIAEELLELSVAARTILEIEVGVVGGEEDGHTAEINDKLYTTVEDGLATVKALGAGETRPLPDGPDVRQRARRLQARRRQAAPVDPRGHPEGRRRRDRQGEPVRPRVPRRLGLDRGRDRRGRRQRRHQDEHRHGHAVRVQPSGRGPLLQQLRRRAQGRRRGGQQEGLRPARLGQARRGRPGARLVEAAQQLRSAGQTLSA